MKCPITPITLIVAGLLIGLLTRTDLSSLVGAGLILTGAAMLVDTSGQTRSKKPSNVQVQEKRHRTVPRSKPRL